MHTVSRQLVGLTYRDLRVVRKLNVAYPSEEEFAISEDGVMSFLDREKYPEYYAALDKSRELENEWHEEDQRNLHRLIEVRPFLWT